MDRLTQAFLPPSRIDLAGEADFDLGRLRVRPARREVEGEGTLRLLQPRVMQVLVALTQSPNGVVSQRELILRCWGGLSISDDAIVRCVAQLRRLAGSFAEPPFEIITVPGVGYRLQPSSISAEPAMPPSRPFARPSVAVIPFANLSDDPAQAYFTVGMVEEIVASLSRFKAIHVVSAGGGVVFEGRPLSPREAARELGVDYLLEGSVRKEDVRVRVTVHLKDAHSGTELWTMRAEEVLAGVFALQDRLAERVAGAIEPLVLDVGIQKLSGRITPSVDGYDLYLRALHLFRDSRKPEMLAAIELLERVLALEPNNALVLGQSAICHRQVVDHEWAHDCETFRQRGLAYAERTMAVGPNDSRPLALAAAALPGLHPDPERPRRLSDRAIALNPASAFAWLISGSVRLRLGRPDEAAEHLETALRLDPISTDGDFARMYLALCRFEQRRFDESLALFGMTTKRLPISYAILAALNGHLGRPEAARMALSMFHDLDAGPIEKFVRLWFPAEPYRGVFVAGIELAAGPEWQRS